MAGAHRLHSRAPMDIDRLRRIAQEIKKKEETTRSLHLASSRQRTMLPPVPELEGFELDAYYEQAAEVSGDFYDFFQRLDGSLGIVIGDVSGHGLEAGIIMGMAKATVSIYGRQLASPKETLCAANDDICAVLDGKTFVSLSYGVLDPEERALRFARAGQNPPILLAGGEATMVKPNGLALGIATGSRFEEKIEEVEIGLELGDIFFQYTDGLVEATDEGDEQYGEERLIELISRYGRSTAKQLMRIVRESLAGFSRSKEHEDDITMVALRARPATTKKLKFEDE